MTESPLEKVWFKTGKKIFTSSSGIVAYKLIKNHCVVAGTPIVKSSTQELWNDFYNWAESQGLGICGYYFKAQDVKHNHLKLYQAGVERVLDTEKLSLQGHQSRDFRRALTKAKEASLVFKEITHQEKQDWYSKMELEEQRWLKTKKGPRIGFLLSSLKESLLLAEERWFVVLNQESKIQAFATILPYSEKLYYMEQMVQTVDGHRFAMDFLIAKLSTLLQEEGIKKLNLGLCAFQFKAPRNLIEWMLKALGWFSAFYNSKGLYQFKRKYSSIEEPCFILLNNKSSKIVQIKTIISATYG